MNYKIISDTSCDLTKEEENRLDIGYVPFKIDIDNITYIDNDDLNISEFIQAMRDTEQAIRTACASPNEYEEIFEKYADAEGLFIVTISSKLSGSYSSATVAANIFKEKYPDKSIYVVDSESASAGHTHIVYELYEYIEAGLEFDEICKKIDEFVIENHTYFVLESLDNLVKNGRIRKTAGLVVNALSIKPIMKGERGDIELHQINRGFKRSLKKLAKHTIELVGDKSDGRLIISHVESLDKAKFLKEMILEKCEFKETRIIQTKGLSSGYAAPGGIVISF